MNILILGAGNMGSALASRFANAGHRVRIAARTAGKAESVAAATGAQAYAPGQLLADDEVVVLATGHADAVPALQALGPLDGNVVIDITNLPSSQLISRKLASTRMVACASPGYLRQHGKPKQPADLTGHRIISYSYWAMRDEWRFAGPAGEASVRTRPFMHTNNGDTCRAAALDHQGIILQPDFLVGPDLQSGALVEVMPGYRSIDIGIHAVYASREHLPGKTRKLVDFLVEAFATPAWQS